MWEWLSRWLKESRRNIEQTRINFNTGWRTTTNRPMTAEEIAALDRAFAKFDEGFRELDKVFGEWDR